MPLYPSPKRWPRSSAECSEAFGFGGWTSLWSAEEATGSLSDPIGGVTLTPNNAPIYGVIRPIDSPVSPDAQALFSPSDQWDRAVEFAAAADRFTAGSNSTFNITTTGQVAFYLCWRAGAVAGTDYIFSKRVGAVYYFAFINSSGHLVAFVSDGTTSLSATVAVNHVDGVYHDIVVCVDRDGGRLLAASDLGVSSSVDISALLTLSTATPFSLGGTDPNRGRCCFMAAATSGVADIRSNVAALIRNIRRYTGRG